MNANEVLANVGLSWRAQEGQYQYLSRTMI
jgi:aspartate ammonia-lyase